LRDQTEGTGRPLMRLDTHLPPAYCWMRRPVGGVWYQRLMKHKYQWYEAWLLSICSPPTRPSSREESVRDPAGPDVTSEVAFLSAL